MLEADLITPAAGDTVRRKEIEVCKGNLNIDKLKGSTLILQ